MTLAILSYFVTTFGILGGLTRMILLIGKGIGQCPETAGVARVGSVSIAAGFLTIGAGPVLVIGAMIPSLPLGPSLVTGTLACAGLASLILGLGFAHAAHLLRSLVERKAPETKSPWPVPIEPVLA